MGLVVLLYEFILFEIFTIAFVGSLFAIWWSLRKCSDHENLQDRLLVSQSELDHKLQLDNYKLELEVYKKWLVGIGIATAVIVAISSGLSAWKLIDFQFLGHAQPQVPCYFIFGDSLVDNGNNNLLTTEAKANYFPYGVDYPTAQSGRFTNGQNIADFIAKYLGFKQPIPANAYARGPAILKGVNYASGASGIREETGSQQGDRISLDRQLQNHKHVVSKFGTLLRRNATQYLRTCLYSVGMGSNDYLNNYLMPENYNTSKNFNSDQYAQALIQQYSQQLKTLYSYGARKVAVFGIGLIGCIPLLIDASGCSTEANTNGLLFDSLLPPLINSLNQNFTDARFTFINVTQISLTPVPDTGITVQSSPCCIVSTSVSLGQCQPGTTPCSNRTTYTFFDNFHPSERAAELLAQRSYSALTSSDSSPFDIKTLAQLKL